eukprot:403348141
MVCPYNNVKCRSGPNIQVTNNNGQKVNVTVAPMYSTDFCYWNISINELSPLSSLIIYTNISQFNQTSTKYKQKIIIAGLKYQFNVSDSVFIGVKGGSLSSLSYFSFSYWVDQAVDNKDLNSNSTTDQDDNDLYTNVPDILLNYKAYLNDQTKEIFWIILYYGISLVVFMMFVTIFGCCYRYIGESYIMPYCTRRRLFKYCWCGCRCKLVWPRFLCPKKYQIQLVQTSLDDSTLWNRDAVKQVNKDEFQVFEIQQNQNLALNPMPNKLHRQNSNISNINLIINDNADDGPNFTNINLTEQSDETQILKQSNQKQTPDHHKKLQQSSSEDDMQQMIIKEFQKKLEIEQSKLDALLMKEKQEKKSQMFIDIEEISSFNDIENQSLRKSGVQSNTLQIPNIQQKLLPITPKILIHSPHQLKIPEYNNNLSRSLGNNPNLKEILEQTMKSIKDQQSQNSQQNQPSDLLANNSHYKTLKQQIESTQSHRSLQEVQQNQLEFDQKSQQSIQLQQVEDHKSLIEQIISNKHSRNSSNIQITQIEQINNDIIQEQQQKIDMFQDKDDDLPVFLQEPSVSANQNDINVDEKDNFNVIPDYEKEENDPYHSDINQEKQNVDNDDIKNVATIISRKDKPKEAKVVPINSDLPDNEEV